MELSQKAACWSFDKIMTGRLIFVELSLAHNREMYLRISLRKTGKSLSHLQEVCPARDNHLHGG
jgi:hypothetical protein